MGRLGHIQGKGELASLMGILLSRRVMVQKQGEGAGWFRSREKEGMQATVGAEGWSSEEICGNTGRVRDTISKLQSY